MRTFSKNKKIRELLLKYSGFKDQKLRNGEYAELFLLVEELAPSLSPLLELFRKDQMTEVVPQEYQDLFRTLSSKSPVCSFMHPSHKTSFIVEEVIKGNVKHDPRLMKMLSEEVPILFALLKDLEVLPKELNPLLSDLLERAQAPFRVKPPSPDFLTLDDDDKNDGAEFPGLPRKRARGTYMQDKKSSRASCHAKGKIKDHKVLLPGDDTI